MLFQITQMHGALYRLSLAPLSTDIMPASRWPEVSPNIVRTHLMLLTRAAQAETVGSEWIYMVRLGMTMQAVHTIHKARIVHSDLKAADSLAVDGTSSSLTLASVRP